MNNKLIDIVGDEVASYILKEFIDDENNLIGNNDEPENGSNQITKVGHSTTDQNVSVSHQNFKNDFLGRFGFYYYENENLDESGRAAFIKKLAALGINKELAMKIVQAVFEHFMEFKSKNEQSLTEEKEMVIDHLTKQKDQSMGVNNKNNDLVSDKVKNTADIIDKMSTKEKESLFKLIERTK